MKAKTLDEIFEEGRNADDIIADLKHKQINVPSWTDLVREYEPKYHPIMDSVRYPDKVTSKGIEPIARITYNTQKLQTKRMAGMCFGTPAEIVFKPEDDAQRDVAKYISNIFKRVRINSVNMERAKQLFASCEVATLWYAVNTPTNIYGFDSPTKLRCRTFSPMNGDEIYPLFDKYGDLIALSIGYTEQTNRGSVQYFDCYTADKHYQWVNEGDGYTGEAEDISIGKIPGVYAWRPEPIWEGISPLVYEREKKMSDNARYLDKNLKPIYCVFDDNDIRYGGEDVKEDRTVLQYSSNARAEYTTWTQAIDSLKFHTDQLDKGAYEQVQIPNWSYEDLKAVRTSGEGLKQLMFDANLKVLDESGRLIEMLDREVNVVKAFLKTMIDGYDDAIDKLQFDIVITPYAINDEKERISNLVLANGSKPIMSQRESVERAGYSADVDKTMAQLAEEGMADVFAE